MRTLFVALLGAALTAAPLHAQQFSLLNAARSEYARQVQAQAPLAQPTASPQPQMSAASKWTGVGLLIGGGMLLASAVVVDNACIEKGEHNVAYCQDVQTAWITTGAAAAGAGGVVLLVGASKKPSAPSVGFGGSGAALRLRF